LILIPTHFTTVQCALLFPKTFFGLHVSALCFPKTKRICFHVCAPVVVVFKKLDRIGMTVVDCLSRVSIPCYYLCTRDTNAFVKIQNKRKKPYVVERACKAVYVLKCDLLVYKVFRRSSFPCTLYLTEFRLLRPKGEQRVHVWKTCACLLIGIDMDPILCVSPAPCLQNKISEKYMSSLRFFEHLVPR
jgi:hypothetical protein